MRKPLLIAAVALAVLTVACSSGGAKPAPSSVTATAMVSATTTAVPARSPSAEETVGGIPLRSLTLGGDIPLPGGLVVYYNVTGNGKGGGPGLIQRSYRDAAGRLHVDLLSEPLKVLGPLVWMAMDADHGLVAAIVCVHALCGAGEGASSSDSVIRLFTSNDGGVSWADRGEIPPDTFVYAVAPGNVILATRPFGQPGRYWQFPSGEPITAPAPDSSPGFIQGIGLVWIREGPGELEIRDWSGSVLAGAGAPFPEARFVASAAGAASALRTFWFSRGIPGAATDGISRFVLVTLDDKRAPSAAFSWDGSNIRFITLIAPTQVLGNVSTPADSVGRFPAALIDLETLTIHPIPELSPADRSTPFVHTALVGTFARVASGSDCLNVREKPSAISLALDCFKEGVLLRLRPQPEQTAEGITWLSVETPDGRAGYASSEFLKR